MALAMAFAMFGNWGTLYSPSGRLDKLGNPTLFRVSVKLYFGAGACTVVLLAAESSMSAPGIAQMMHDVLAGMAGHLLLATMELGSQGNSVVL